MRSVMVFLAVAVFLLSELATASQKNRKRRAEMGDTPKKKNVTPRQAKTLRREQMRSSEQWRRAKEQQDDAELVHSVSMDSCEGRLESLKVLYNAGILDRQEYEQRVARVKAKHEH
ncbi:MAG: hypothetical protein II587_02060 [Oscillospiraceae bacterium]|nr:hypothetical protein [Oscillospiraceae bacterium]